MRDTLVIRPPKCVRMDYAKTVPFWLAYVIKLVKHLLLHHDACRMMPVVRVALLQRNHHRDDPRATIEVQEGFTYGGATA